MSWLYSRVLVEEYLGDISLDGEQSALSNGNPIQQAYCAPDKMTGFSRLSQFGMTYKLLTESLGEELLMLYREGFHAKTFQPLEKAQDLKEKGQECGITWRGWLAKYDPNTCSWKTPQCSLLGEEQESLATLPKWGMTVNGLLWEQPMLEPITKGTESGYSLPTPTCNPHLPNKNANTKGPKNLMEIAEGKWEHLMPKKMWASPIAGDWKYNGPTQGNRKSPNLGTQVHWPTPRASDYKGSTSAEAMGKAAARGFSPNLPEATAATVGGGKLNPTWVEWLMGWPLGWTDLKPLEMDKSHCVQQQHGNF